MDTISDYKHFLDSILCTIVLYKSNLNDSNAYKSIVSVLEKENQHIDFFIYDNSPIPDNNIHLKNVSFFYAKQETHFFCVIDLHKYNIFLFFL